MMKTCSEFVLLFLWLVI